MDTNVKGHLLDTNILIYHWKGDIPNNETERIDDILKRSFIISIITKIELLGWRAHTTEGLAVAKEFLGRAKVVPVDDELANDSAEVIRPIKSMGKGETALKTRRIYVGYYI